MLGTNSSLLLKDDVDTFIVDMKMLASILGHNKDVIMEKFKDIFPESNIEAALIAMDDFAAIRQSNSSRFINLHMTVQWHQLQYLFIQHKMHLPKESRHNRKVISISWPR